MIAVFLLLFAYKYSAKFKGVFRFLPILFISIFCIISADICTDSYSNYTVKALASQKNSTQRVIVEKTRIYCPSSVGFKFPGWFPIKSLPGTLKEGEKVIVDEGRMKKTYWTEKEYIEVSNGKIAGYVEKERIRK